MSKYRANQYLILISNFSFHSINQVEVFVGSIAKLTSQPKVSVIKLISNPDFDQYTLEHNIALIQLNQAVITPTANPVNLPTAFDDDFTFADRRATVTGWGQSYKLMHVDGTVVSQASCKRYFSNYVRSTEFCLEELDENACQRCNSEFGSPLVTKDGQKVLIGIGSEENCGVGIRGKFVRVSSYINWINEKTK